ncbi:U3 small nucleolar RNA-associated protein 4 homolog [Portunus trituberculatus]|uniref:U3 small nucleolar RNA-associated protein 4 homolog n=1 Tax=Portunus trituberculatus TaxID=210409 RepID=UPI001E1CB6F5|nr:U3 small nucleolar RNA-associated protein 4 homolog [Portunus trituberculatus]
MAECVACKQSSMAQYTIHNVRFFDFNPKAIHCMSYDDATSRLALSRTNGDIEIWNCWSRPFMQLFLPGDNDSSVEAMVWCQGRLFSAGLHGFLLEHNLASREVTLRTPITGGPTWCLALSKDKKKLAAGTERGYVCIFDVVDSGVMYDRALEKQEGRILHIAWHISGDYIVTGSVNCVRVWSLKEGRVARCGLGAADRKDEVIVWCVGILDDMTLVSGDSSGRVCFWNAELGTVTHSVHTHKADILALTVCPDQKSVYVAGVDPTIVQVSRVETGTKKGKVEMWVKGIQRSIHTHDVRALVVTATDRVYSGGVDTILTLSYFPPRTVCKFPALPPLGSISVAREAESLLLQYSDHVELWRLGASSKKGGKSGTFLPVTKDRVKLLELQGKDDEVIQWCAVSPKARWIAYLVQGSLRIYHFTPPASGKQPRVQRVKEVSQEIKKSHQMLWLSEGKLVSAAVTGAIQIINVSGSKAELEKELTLSPGHSVLQMTCDLEGKMLAVVDSKNIITIFDIEKETISVLPGHSSPCTAVGIHPLTKEVVAVYADMSIKEYDPSKQCYTAFCRQHLNEPSSELAKKHSVILRVSFDPDRPDLILLHNESAFVVVQKDKKAADVSQEKAPKVKKVTSGSSPGKGAKAGIGAKFSVIRRPNQVLLFSQMKGEAVVSVELNPLQVMDRLPSPLKVKKYGGT